MNHASLERVRHSVVARGYATRGAEPHLQDASDVALGISVGTFIDGGYYGEEG